MNFNQAATHNGIQYVDHVSHTKFGFIPFPDRLYVVTAISNPARYLSRYNLYRAFERRCADSGAILYTVEMAFGGRPFEVTDSANPRHIQIRSSHELWHKENLLNIGIGRLPPEARYIAWVDADVQFSRPDWAQETLHKLQHYQVVQMFSHSQDLGPIFQPIDQAISWTESIKRGLPFKGTSQELVDGSSLVGIKSPGPEKGAWHSGLAWAARREALDGMGGLIDFAVLGCYDDQTEVYTDRGFILFKDLTENDQVLSLSPTKEIEWGKVDKLFKYQHDGEMYRIKNQSVDLLVTPNHNMLFETKDARKLVFKQAQNSKGGGRVPKTGIWKGALEKNHHASSSKLWAAFMGIWLSKGWTYLATDGSGSHRYRIGITQKPGHKKDKIREMLLKAFPNIRFTEDILGFTGTNKELFQYLRKLGKTPSKFIPSGIKAMPPEYLKIFLEWYALGDDTIYTKNEKHIDDVHISTSSVKMRDDIMEVIIKSGGWADYYENPIKSNKLKNGRIITSTPPNYTIRFQRGKYFYIKRRNISKEYYSGMVYCCETPNHTLLVRRNKKVIWCGNSADRNMAAGLFGFINQTIDPTFSPEYKKWLNNWQDRVIRTIRKNVGQVDGVIYHHWHGPKLNRKYTERWKILSKHQFNPLTDIRKDAQGLWQLEDAWDQRSIDLRNDIRNYFAQRDEDSTYLGK